MESIVIRKLCYNKKKNKKEKKKKEEAHIHRRKREHHSLQWVSQIQFILNHSFACLIISYVFYFLRSVGSGGPETDPNLRQTQILDPNPTQASI